MGGSAVLGVDGCRAGWVGVLHDVRTVQVLVAPHITGLVGTALHEVRT